MPDVRTIIDENRTLVEKDGGGSYTEIGADLNVLVNSKLEAVDKTSFVSGVGISQRTNSTKTKHICAINSDSTIVDVIRRSDSKKFTITVNRLVGFNDGEVSVDAQGVVSFKGDIFGKGSIHSLSLGTIDHVAFSYDFVNSGAAYHCNFSSSLIVDHPFDYYGLIYTINDANILDVIRSDDTTQIVVKSDGTQFIELFHSNEFRKHDRHGNPTVELKDYQNDYTTVGGPLTGNTVLTAGTYFGTSVVDLNNFSLTLDCSSGKVVYKHDGGVHDGIESQETEAGSILVTNTTDISYAVFTSMHDNTVGETIAGSSGSPVKGDVTRPYMYSRGATVYNFEKIEFRYCESAFGVAVHRNLTDKTGADVTIGRAILKNCGIPSGLSFPVSLLGKYRYNNTMGDINISNISIDNTNSISDSSLGKGIGYYCQNATYDGIYYEPTGTAVQGVGVYPKNNNVTYTLNNIYSKCNVVLFSDTAAIFCSAHDDNDDNLTFKVRNCIGENTGLGHGISAFEDAVNTAISFDIKSNIIMNCDGISANGINESGAVTFVESNNGFFNNTDDMNGSVPTNPVEADPELGNILDGSITSDYFLPNGFAVTNLTDYEKNGHDTFDNEGVDENTFTATGFRYLGTDNLTPGCHYNMDAFIGEGLILTLIPPAVKVGVGVF